MNALKKSLFVFVLFSSSVVFALREDQAAALLERLAREEIKKTPQEDLNEKLVDAAKKGRAQDVQTLLSAGAPTDVYAYHNTTALVVAAEEGHVDVVKLLVSAGARVDAADIHSNTPLICAAGKGHEEIVQVLLRAGADVRLTNCMGSTALHGAALQGHAGIVQALLNAKVDARIENYMGKTARDIAREKGHTEIDTLIKNYLEPAGSSASGLTREDYNDKLIAAVMKGDTETVITCLAAGADVDVTACVDNASYRKTALMIAAERGHAGAVSALIAGGATVNAADDYGWTALFIALDKAHTETVRILLAAGAAKKCNAKELEEFLMSAAYKGHREIVDLVRDYLKNAA